MKPLSEYLTLLADTAQDIMRRPARELPETLTPAFIHVAAEVRRIDASPAEGVRCTRAGIMMINAIAYAHASRSKFVSVALSARAVSFNPAY